MKQKEEASSQSLEKDLPGLASFPERTKERSLGVLHFQEAAGRMKQ